MSSEVVRHITIVLRELDFLKPVKIRAVVHLTLSRCPAIVIVSKFAIK